ncbi:unnamed protein product [Sphagnum balticum]
MHMLRLMGIPVIQAPGEAEAQCSYMSRHGKVDAVCTEDTDCLVFGAQTMVRDVNNRKEPVTEITRSENEKEGKLKYILPKEEDFSFEDARELFKNPRVTDEYELKWEKNIDEEALRKFLIEEKQFAEFRLDGAIKKLKANKGTQPRL